MRSIFKEFENQLIEVINEVPLTIEAKYYILKSVFQEVANAYQNWINMEDSKIKNISKEEEEKTTIKRINEEDGKTTILAKGNNLADVVSNAIKETQR